MSDDKSELTMDSLPGRLANPAANGTANGTAIHNANGTANSHAASSSEQLGAGMAGIADSVSMLPFTEARARALEEFDRAFLSAALARNAGNIARTARSLGLHRQSLQKLMARRGIKSERSVVAKAV